MLKKNIGLKGELDKFQFVMKRVAISFINEKLISEQKEDFLSLNVKGPIFSFGHIIREIDMEVSWQWIIDKERKMYLIGTSYYRDYLDEKVFVFIWKSKHFLVQLNFSFENSNTGVWNIPKKYLIDTRFSYCTEEHFLDDLRDVLLAHGIVVNDFTNGKCNNGKCNIKCNF